MRRRKASHTKKDGFNDLQKWIGYFDKFWTTKLKKLETFLNNKSK